MEMAKVDQIVRDYDSQSSWLVMILQEIHRACGSLPDAAVRHVAECLQLDPHHVDDVAMFYRKFGLEQLSRALTTFSINEEVCKGCGLCRRKCPVEAVTGIQKGRHEIDLDKCTRCGLCRDNCRLNSVVTTWHTELEFVRCDECGQPLATAKELETIRDVLSANPNMAPFCPSCQRAKMASRWAAVITMPPANGRTATKSAPEEMY